MNKPRLEMKVGLFACIALVLLALLLLQFTKGLTFFRDTYLLRMHAGDVGGLKPRASVLMSGVQVGTVSEIQLAPDGKSVTIFLKIYANYVIYTNAGFAIEASGFLGDQYVAIIQPEHPGDRLLPNSDVTCAEPLNIQQVARDAAGFIKRVDEAARKLDDTISDIRRLALSEQNLTNLAATMKNMRTVSEQAIGAMDQVNALLATNTPVFTASASNIAAFAEAMDRFSDTLNEVVTTNRESISVTVKNVESSSAVLKSILDDAHAGKGLAGTLLHNDAVAANVALIVSNLTLTSSNLNRLGLWRVMFPREPRPTNGPPAGAMQSPKAAGH